MKFLVAAVLALAIAGAGCVIVPARGVSRSPASAKAKRCPPGHQWSDGACHAKGKGHDR